MVLFPATLTVGFEFTTTVVEVGDGQNPAAVGVTVYVPLALTVMLWVTAPVDQSTLGEEAVRVTLLPWQKVNGPEAATLSVNPASNVVVIVLVEAIQFPPNETVQL